MTKYHAPSNRTERRRVDRAIRDLIKRDGDHCSICRTTLAHNAKTFFGSIDCTVVLVGECCAQQLQSLYAQGVYSAAPYNDLLFKGGTANRSSAEQAAEAVEACQQFIAETDSCVSAAIAKRAGLMQAPPVQYADSDWKRADAAFFNANPKRAHRLRPEFSGEHASSGELEALLPGHEFYVLVRQVMPGVRVRLHLQWKIDIPIPDSEALVHALYDLYSGRQPGESVTTQEVLTRAVKYQHAERVRS